MLVTRFSSFPFKFVDVAVVYFQAAVLEFVRFLDMLDTWLSLEK